MKKAEKILTEHLRLHNRIKCIEADIAVLTARAESIGSFDYSGVKVKTSPEPSATYEAVIELKVSKQQEADELTAQWLESLKRVEELLGLIPSGQARDVLHLHYADGMKYHDVAQTLGKSDQTVYKYRKKGMDILEKRFSEL